MDTQEYVLVSRLCTHYAIEQSFFYRLRDNGLIEVRTIDRDDYLHQDHLRLFEKILRINRDLHVDADALDIIVGLLQRVETLQHELDTVRNHLALYEG
jgi:hypothetical protein